MISAETERLILRPFEASDAAAVTFYTDPDVMRYIPSGPWDPGVLKGFSRLVRSREALWKRSGFPMWAIVLKETGRLIGHCGLQPMPGPGQREVEIFYLVDKPYWGRGIGTEAARATLRFGFEHTTVPRIVAIAMPANTASLRVMEKAGMRRSGMARHYGFDVVRYEVSRAEYERSTVTEKA